MMLASVTNSASSASLLSSVANSANTGAAIDAALLQKSQELEKMQGQDALLLIQSSSQTGSGHTVDTYA